MPIKKKIKKIYRMVSSLVGYHVVPNSNRLQANVPAVQWAFRVLREHISEPYFVQIGANDGVTHDPTCSLLEQYAFPAILVEPMVEAFEVLCGNRGDRKDTYCINLAVGGFDGTVELWLPSGNALKSNVVGSGSRVASVRPEQVRSKGFAAEARTVPQATFKTLVSRCKFPRVDFLQIDAEGIDWELLKLAFDSGLDPALINLEHHNLRRSEREELRVALTKRGYLWIEATSDTTALKAALMTRPQS